MAVWTDIDTGMDTDPAVQPSSQPASQRIGFKPNKQTTGSAGVEGKHGHTYACLHCGGRGQEWPHLCVFALQLCEAGRDPIRNSEAGSDGGTHPSSTTVTA